MTFTVFQTLAAAVYLPVLPKKDREHLQNLSKRPKKRKNDPLAIIVKRIESRKTGYYLPETGCHLSNEYQEKLREKYAAEGLSETFLAILKAAQTQRVSHLILTESGCYPDHREPAELPKLGKKPLTRKETRSLLKNLILHHDFYPTEQLTNVLRPALEKTTGEEKKR